jgi:hypothetical protein
MPDTLSAARPATTVAIETAQAPYIDWASVVAGTFVGAAVIATLTAFGSAVGLSVTSAFRGHGASAYATAVAVAIWTLWVVISGYIAAGYVAGRMRHLSIDASEHEAELRNGTHGLVAWAITTIIVAALTASAVFGGQHAFSSQSGGIAEPSYAADQLLRTDRPDGGYDQGLHHEVATILQRAALPGGVSSDDRTYLVRLVTARGAPAADATKRVDTAITEVKDQAETARKTGVLLGFLTAASLAVGAAASWWAAKVGGAHRQDYVGVSAFTRWR